ncbi:MAG: signal recognition particle-docking protein FtsY, partial [Kurthia sp.]
MSFFKRLKEKLIGGSEEKESLEQLDQIQQEADHLPLQLTEKEEIETPVEEQNSQAVIQAELPEKREEISKPEVIEVERNEIVVNEEAVEGEKQPSAWSITQKFKAGLEKTRHSFTSKVNDLVARYRKVDEDF